MKRKESSNCIKGLIATALFTLFLTGVFAQNGATSGSGSFSKLHLRGNVAALLVGSFSGEAEKQFNEHFTGAISGYIKPRYYKESSYFREYRGLNLDVRYFPWKANRGEGKVNLYVGMGVQWSYKHTLRRNLFWGGDGHSHYASQRTAVGLSPSIGWQVHHADYSLNVFAAPVLSFYEHHNTGYGHQYSTPLLVPCGMRFGIFVGI